MGSIGRIISLFCMYSFLLVSTGLNAQNVLVKTAPGLDQVTEDEVTSLLLYSDFLDTYYYLPFITKVVKSYKNEKADDISKYTTFYSLEDKSIQSETGELKLKPKNGTFELPFITVKINNSWASVIVVSKDGKPLEESKNFYLVVVGPTKMSGQKYNDSRPGLTDIGDLPVLAQVIDGKVLFKKDISKAVVSPLHVDGTKGKAVKTAGNVFHLNSGRTFVYESILK